MEKCPRCGFRAFDGELCSTCSFRLGARIGRRGFISLALGAAAAALLSEPETLLGFPVVADPQGQLFWIDGMGPGLLRPNGIIRSLEPFVYEPYVLAPSGPVIPVIEGMVIREPGRYEVPLVQRPDPLGQDGEGPQHAAGPVADSFRELDRRRKP